MGDVMEIKELRKLTGLSQKQFSEKYGIPLPTIRHWEQGQRECPRYVLDLLEFKVKKEIEISHQ